MDLEISQGIPHRLSPRPLSVCRDLGQSQWERAGGGEFCRSYDPLPTSPITEPSPATLLNWHPWQWPPGLELIYLKVQDVKAARIKRLPED